MVQSTSARVRARPWRGAIVASVVSVKKGEPVENDIEWFGRRCFLATGQFFNWYEK
jgi:hypothetical protein